MAGEIVDALGRFQIRPTDGFGEFEVSRAGSSQGGHMSPATQQLAEVVAVGANIESLRAVNPKTNNRERDFQDFVFVDADLAGWSVDGLAFPGQFVEGNPVFFDGGDHWRNLVELAGKLREGGFDRGSVQGGHRFGLEDFAGCVLGVGGLTQLEGALVFLVLGHEEVLDAGGLADDEHEKSRGDGVEGAAMADLALVEPAANKIDDIVGGLSGRLVDEQQAIKLRDHGKWFSLTFTGKPEWLNS